jgi:histone-binding protein RBBP4
MNHATATGDNPTIDVLQERLIDAEYKIWKKNTPYLYDFVMTHSLEWPSLSCQWLPTVRNLDNCSEHSLLLGTHTTGEQNYLMIATCALPKETAEKVSAAAVDSQYDEEKKEVGGFGLASGDIGRIEIKLKVKHEGEVNRARYMPQNHFVVATRGPNSEVYIFDLSKHPSTPTEQSPFSPQGVCIGHSKEGYSMEWSPHNQGILATGSEDTTVKLWDVNVALESKATPGTQIKAMTTLTGHTDVVEDVDWHATTPNLLGSVSDDKTIRIWDTKNPQKEFAKIENAHDEDINCISFNPINDFVFATGSADKTVAIWDMRKLESKVQTLVGHQDQVYTIQWAPHDESVLASCSADRRVGIWDLSRIGKEQSAEDAEDGPPELLFLHGGHTSKVSDFSWNKNDPWTVASVSEDNVLQVWNMAEEIYANEEEEGNDNDEDDILDDDELE